MSAPLTTFCLSHTKIWLYGICLVIGMMLSVLVLVSHPQLYLLISDSLNWRLGTPSVLQTRLETALRAVHLRSDPLIDDRGILLFGDSHLHSFPSSFLGGAVVNYAIAGETAENLAERIKHYVSPTRARQIVLLTGRNDLRHGRSPQAIAVSVGRVLDQIPATTRAALVGIPPLRIAGQADESTQETNRLLADLCSDGINCLFIDTQSLVDASGSLRADFAMADGIHLTGAGYARLATLLNNALRLPAPSPLYGLSQ